MFTARKQQAAFGKVAELADRTEAPDIGLLYERQPAGRVKRTAADVDIAGVRNEHPQIIVAQKHAQLVSDRCPGGQLDWALR